MTFVTATSCRDDVPRSSRHSRSPRWADARGLAWVDARGRRTTAPTRRRCVRQRSARRSSTGELERGGAEDGVIVARDGLRAPGAAKRSVRGAGGSVPPRGRARPRARASRCARGLGGRCRERTFGWACSPARRSCCSRFAFSLDAARDSRSRCGRTRSSAGARRRTCITRLERRGSGGRPPRRRWPRIARAHPVAPAAAPRLGR
jgi:hypothetical protein